MENNLQQLVNERAKSWLSESFDKETRDKVKFLMENDPKELMESFYTQLEFGTGGLRGIMGVGTNRMNIYTLGMATQGLSNYLKKQFSHLPEIRVAIAHDTRINSRLFAETTAQIFSANGFSVYLFEGPRPTPELSYALRKLNCQSGIVITASHNPKEYNGYKVYWEDGGQIIAPHDVNIIQEVNSITSIDQIKFHGKPDKIRSLDSKFDDIYINSLKELSINPKIIASNSDIKIVYTPIHGTGKDLVPKALAAFGFRNVIKVAEQDFFDGNFPTVVSPNPEEAAALDLALRKADETGADIVLGTDPDADRVGLAIRDKHGKMILLNGNQTASILFYYLLSQWREKGKLTGNEFTVKTIVTTDLLSSIANHFKVECFEVLTGFKYIANIIKENEGKKQFIVGGEESYGYLVGDMVRDKDAVMSCAMISEAAAWAKSKGITLYDLLINIYSEFGLYREKLVSITKKGKEGKEEIAKMMTKFRQAPPETIDGSMVMLIHDYEKQSTYDLLSQLRYAIALPKSDVLQIIVQDGTKISIRPSGTEPKIKLYFGVKGNLATPADFEKEWNNLDQKVDRIIKELNL